MTAAPSDRPASAVDPKLLEILVCPLTKGPLEYDREANELISGKAGLAYPVRAGFPYMLPARGRPPRQTLSVRPTHVFIKNHRAVAHGHRLRPGDKNSACRVRQR